MGDTSPDRKSACGLLNAVFGRRSFWPRKSSSNVSIPTANGNIVKGSNNLSNSKRRRNGSDDESTFLDCSPQLQAQQKPQHHPVKCPPVYHQHNNNGNGRNLQEHNQSPKNRQILQSYVSQGRRVPKEAVGISGELESMINDHQKSKGHNTLVRASSGNVMLMSNLGNLRQPTGAAKNYASYDDLEKPAREETANYKSKEEKPVKESLCRAISTRMDPEQLKIMGNEDYKNGNFAEALSLYEAAIAIDPKKASYRSNKSAALTALGRLLEAVFECREAIQIDPRYHRAHHRLANLHIRLGEADKAIYHYKHAGPEADQDDIAKARTLQAHLNKCTEAKRLRDWHTLVKETQSAITDGADSASLIYALQAEAFLKLHRHQDADEALRSGPNFDVDDCTKFFGPIGNANLLVVRAQVDIATGRFENALGAIQRAARLDSNNREVNAVMRRARAISAARLKGNDLFKTSRFSEACVAYGEGLEHDPYNSVLLCNRAACRSKLGQYEKAVEDCSTALNLRPRYTKARLRRADCNAKLGKWEVSIQDYEILRKEMPNDEEVSKGLHEAKANLKK
ncbi:hypothetical protein ACFE04_020742 [Oxalis oulophora]